MDFLNIKKGGSEEFHAIAQKLFDEYVIQANNIKYRLAEIEFYWHSEKHPDKCTYPRIHVNPKTGDWFFHYSGVDIALKSDDGYGGILIRSIYNIEKKELTKGPMISSMKLFSENNAFGSITTSIIREKLNTSAIKTDVRVGINPQNDNPNYKYNFSIKEYLKNDSR